MNSCWNCPFCCSVSQQVSLFMSLIMSLQIWLIVDGFPVLTNCHSEPALSCSSPFLAKLRKNLSLTFLRSIIQTLSQVSYLFSCARLEVQLKTVLFGRVLVVVKGIYVQILAGMGSEKEFGSQWLCREFRRGENISARFRRSFPFVRNVPLWNRRWAIQWPARIYGVPLQISSVF